MRLGGRPPGRWRAVASGMTGLHTPTEEAPPPPPAGAPLYVDAATGNDSRTLAQARNPATPWASIHRAMKGAAPGAGTNPAQAAAAGDTVIVTPGTYAAYGSPGNGFAAVALEPVNQGAAGAPIRVQATNNAPRAISLVWGDANYGAIIGCRNNQYVEFSGFSIDENLMPMVGRWADTAQVWIQQSSHVTIERCKFTGLPVADRGGDNYKAIEIHSNPLDDILITNCWFTDWGVVEGGSANNSGIIWYFLDGLVTVDHCLFENSGCGMYWKGGGDPYVMRCVVRYSIFRNNKVGMALFTGANNDPAAPSLVYQNLFLNNREAGPRLFNLGAGLVNDVKFLHNVFDTGTVGEYPVGIWGSWAAEVNNGNGWYNNIFRGSDQFGIAYRDEQGGFNQLDPARFDFQDNVYTNCAIDEDGLFANLGVDHTWPGWRTTYGYDTPRGVLTSAQIFVDRAGGDYHLVAGSPALNVARARYGIGGADGTIGPAGLYLTGSETIGLEV